MAGAATTKNKNGREYADVFAYHRLHDFRAWPHLSRTGRWLPGAEQQGPTPALLPYTPTVIRA
jgi:hypothetical protein